MKNIILLMLIVFYSSVYSQDIKTSSIIKVQGSATTKVTPDECTLYLAISYIGLDPNLAIIGLDQKVKEIGKQIKASGFKDTDMLTSNFTVSKNVLYRDEYTKDSGYVANQSIKVKFKFSKEQVVKILNNITKSRSDYNLSFEFGLSDSLKLQTSEKLIAQAVKDAKNKSNLLAKELGVKLKGVSSVDYVSNIDIYPEYTGKNYAMHAGDGMLDLQGYTPEEIVKKEEVMVTWTIE
ncbi:MAG: SIMPL domain-containing protein [Bacteroidia bacterium]|nr:SIMPL domain-containing protein [Bacteroidia bacterium]MCZ2248686.1 SIMPL domain-containing protein [Bacteroidia bacterium]